MKLCTKCKTKKPHTEFTKNSHTLDGLRNACKSCEKIRQADYYKAHKEEISKRNIAWKKANPKKLLTEEEQEKVKQRAKEYYEKNKDKIKQAAKEYRKTEKGIENGKMSKALYYGRKKATNDGTITVETLRQLREQQFNACKYCGTSFITLPDRQIHLDHIIPVSKGGQHSLTNVVWSCARCNQHKSSTMPAMA